MYKLIIRHNSNSTLGGVELTWSGDGVGLEWRWSWELSWSLTILVIVLSFAYKVTMAGFGDVFGSASGWLKVIELVLTFITLLIHRYKQGNVSSP